MIETPRKRWISFPLAQWWDWEIEQSNSEIYDQKLFPKETCNYKTIPGKNWIISQGEIINF